MIFFEPGISEADHAVQYHAAGKDRFRQNLFTAVSGGARDHQIGQFFPPVGGYLFFAVSLVGIISMTVLNTLRYLPMFSVYYICGCRWRNCAWIILAYLLCMFAVVAAAALIFWPYMVIKDLLFSMQILLTGYNILATVPCFFWSWFGVDSGLCCP